MPASRAEGKSWTLGMEAGRPTSPIRMNRTTRILNLPRLRLVYFEIKLRSQKCRFSQNDMIQVWRPDKERRVETAVVKYADRIVSIAIKDLRVGVFSKQNCWIFHSVPTNRNSSHFRGYSVSYNPVPKHYLFPNALPDLQTKHPSVWNHALKLIAHLLDTNHLPTHCALLDAFRKANFQEVRIVQWLCDGHPVTFHLNRIRIRFSLWVDLSSSRYISLKR